MRRLPTGPLLLVICAIALLVAPAGSAGAADNGHVDVVKVNGLIDPVVARFVGSAIDDAERTDAVALVLQLDSGGAVVRDAKVEDLARRIHDSSVPVAVWIGPSRHSHAYGAAGQLAGVVKTLGMAPGTHIGKLHDEAVPAALLTPRFRQVAPNLRRASVSDKGAAKLGIAKTAPTVGDFIVDLAGVKTKVVKQGDQLRRRPLTTVRFGQLPLVDQLMHTVASPAVAYLLFIIGMGLLLFELYTAGIGIAGAVGAASMVLGAYGLAVLHARPLGIALLVFAMFGFGIDVQTGVPRVWTGIATVSFVLGSLVLYDGVRLSWITLVAAVVGMVLAMLAGMPAMVRTRFSTPTIGREWMIGEMGEAVAAVAPDGVVRIREALWRARTNRATPISPGDRVRVTGLDGLTLEVEPEEGGARDYRDRSPKS